MGLSHEQKETTLDLQIIMMCVVVGTQNAAVYRGLFVGMIISTACCFSTPYSCLDRQQNVKWVQSHKDVQSLLTCLYDRNIVLHIVVQLNLYEVFTTGRRAIQLWRLFK